MSKQLKPDTEALDAYFASFEPIDVRPQTPTRLPMASSRISSRARSTRRLCLEQLEAREVPSATVFGDASNNWDSALVSTPPSDSYETVDVRLVPHSSGIVVDNANVNFGEGVLIKVSTGTGAGTVLKDDALTSLDDAYNTLHGTAANPLGTDHMNFNFVSRLTGAIAIRLKQLDLGHIAHGNVLIDGSNGRTTVPIPSNGVIPWNPTVGIDSIMLVNVHNQGELNPVGLSGIDVQMYLPDTPVDIGTLTTQVAALTQQVSTAQTALTAAEATATPPPALDALPWPEGVNASAKILGKLNVHPGQNLYAMHFSPDGNKFVTAGQDKVAKIWNASTGALLHTLSGNNSLVMDAVWSADGQSVWTTGYDKHVRQYSASTGAVLWDSGDLGSLALSTAMSSDGANLTVSMHGTAPKVINTQTKAINALGSGLIWTGNMTAMSDANVLMFVNTNAYRSGNYALIVNPATRQTVWQSNVMGGQLNAIAATPDGQWIIAGDDAGGLAVWKRSTNQQVFTLPNQGGVITSIATSEDGNQLFVGSGSQITAFDLRPLTTNQAPTLLHTYASIGNGPRGMSVQGKNVTAVSGDNGASRLVAVDRSGLSGYVDPNLGVNTAQAQLTALQNSLASSTSQLQLAQNQETGRDAIMEILAQQLVEPQSVEADTLEVTVQGNRVDAEMTLRTVGGNVRISSWQGVRSSLPSLDRDDDGSLLFTGSAATLDLAQATHLVTSVSFVVTTSTGHDATVRFLRGDQVIATQTVHSGATVSQADAQGITGVVVLNEEQSLSEQAQDFLAYFNSNDGQYQAGRYAWSWWTQNGYKTFPQFGGASLAYFANHSSVPDAQKWDILREAASGRHYATLQLADIDVQGNVNQAQAAAPHPLEQTPTGLLLNAPDWRQTGDTLRRGASPGYLATGRFSPTAVGIVRDPTKYSVVNLTNVSGDAHPVSVRYHTPGGDTQLGQEYYQILGNSVVLMPGAPSQIVITLHSGDIYQAPGNVDIGHIQSNTLEDILPPETMSVWTSILAIRNTGPAEGVMNAVTEITDTGRAITPGSGNALVNVWNSGRTGGTVRIITNEGTPQAHEISFSLAAQAGKSVSINFTTPANGVLSITTILPDGRRLVDGKTLRLQGDTSEKRVATRNADGTWTLEWKASTYSGPSVVDGGVIDNNFVLWKQARIAKGDLSVADPANYAKAVMAFAEEQDAQDKERAAAPHIVAAEGDIVTAMTRDSLTRIRDNAQQALAAAIVQNNQEHIDHFTAQLEAANGLLALIPAGSDTPVIGTNQQALAWQHLIETTTSDPLVLVSQSLNLLTSLGSQKESRTYSFHVESTMLLDGTFRSDTTFAESTLVITDQAGRVVLSLAADGDHTFTVKQTLLKGNYTMTIVTPSSQYASKSNAVAGWLGNIEASRTSHIEGMVQLGEQAMPVSLRVAEFGTNGQRKTDYETAEAMNRITTLDPTKPVWIVIHGMSNSENTNTISELARILSQYEQMGIQVVTLDWNKEAADWVVPTQDVNWAPLVGQWAARQLIAAGFDPALINVAGHSHGTYVGYEMASEIMRLTNGNQMNAFVALDAAGNMPLFSGYDHTQINFASKTRSSLAFDSSFGAGSNALAATADVAMEINSSDINPATAHSLAVTAFTEILRRQLGSASPFSSYLSLGGIMQSSDQNRSKYSENHYDGIFEGKINVTISPEVVNGHTYYRATPVNMLLWAPGDTSEETVAFNTLP